MAKHLFSGHTIVDWAYAQNPDSIVWCVRSDGRLLGLTYNKAQDVWAWHQHVTKGKVKSVTSIPENGRSAVYVAVERNIDGADKVYIERLEPQFLEVRDTIEDAFYLDSALSYDGAPTDLLSGLDHLEGEVVSALCDGVVVKDLVVTLGQVQLPRQFSVIHIGIPYESRIKTLPIDIDSRSRGKTKRISKVGVSVVSSRGMFYGQDLDRLEELKQREISDNYGAMEAKTGEYQASIDARWDRVLQLYFVQKDPLPMHIIGLSPEVVVGGS